MLAFPPQLAPGSTVLCIGAHCDDIELGCSGALMELTLRSPGLRVVWVVFSGDPVRQAETRAAAELILGAAASHSVIVHDFPVSYFPYSGGRIKDCFETLRTQIDPQLIFSHHLADRHQDHRLIAELTWNSFRRHAILEYEIAKFEGDLGQPNCFMPLSRTSLQRKLDMLDACFVSQRDRSWFDPQLFRGHMRLRGMECNAAAGHAEAFHVRKLIL